MTPATRRRNTWESRLTAERVRELLRYDPATGVFIRRERSGDARYNALYAGKVAGCITDHGYVRMVVDGRQYPAHRLAWLYVHGEWPALDVDHRDNVRHHNWISNLRLATRTQNNANMSLYSHSSSGIKGVSWDRARGKWGAQIKVNRKTIHLGRFDDQAEAAAAYRAAAEQHFGEFARLA